jgi:S1-C subfamily serine protease
MQAPPGRGPVEPQDPRPQWAARQAARTRRLLLGAFTLGVAATLLALYLYSIMAPPPASLTASQVNTMVAEALAEDARAGAALEGTLAPADLVAALTATPRTVADAEAADAEAADAETADAGTVSDLLAPAAAVYRTIQPSLVRVESNLVVRGILSVGQGSGVLISDQGQILTALHVVEGADAIEITYADGTRAAARIDVARPDCDIAVLQAERLPESAVPATLGDPAALVVGDEIYAAGSPYGLAGSLSAGVVSGLDRAFEDRGRDEIIDGLIQVDAAVNPGNSGGPLLNRSGEVVGIVVGVYNPSGESFFVGVGFAVPITRACDVDGEMGQEAP